MSPTSGLVAPEVVAVSVGQIEPEPADDASVRLARQLIEGGWLTTLSGEEASWRAPPAGSSWVVTG